MAASYKVLGQLSPVPITLVDLYTVPALTQAVVSTLTVCNRTINAVAFRLAIRPLGAAIADKHYAVYDASLDPADSLALTIGLTLGATDVVSVYTSAPGGLSFGLYGSEIT